MNSTSTAPGLVEVDDLDPAGVLEALQEADHRVRAAEADKLRLVAHWCVLHPATSQTDAATWAESGHRDLLECDETPGGDGTPLVAAFTAEELATTLGVSPYTAIQLIADVLNLIHRHPMTWARVQALEVPGWRARRIAQRSASLCYESARWVDEQLADRADSIGPVTIDRHVQDAQARFEPETLKEIEDEAKAAWGVRLAHPETGTWAGTSMLDAVGDTGALTRFHDLLCATAEELGRDGDRDTFEQRKAKAFGVIADQLTGSTPDNNRGRRGGPGRFYLHLDATMLDQPNGVGAIEQLGPATMNQLRTWLHQTQVTVVPVIDLNNVDAVDCYRPPAWMEELVRLRDRHCVFPWCPRDSRGCDLDHITPFDPGTDTDPGPPGQTRPDNLAPLCRRHHRAKTSGRWRYRRHRDGTYTWTTPHGHHYLVTATNTTETD
jgi:hypothetical protein